MELGAVLFMPPVQAPPRPLHLLPATPFSRLPLAQHPLELPEQVSGCSEKWGHGEGAWTSRCFLDPYGSPEGSGQCGSEAPSTLAGDRNHYGAVS